MDTVPGLRELEARKRDLLVESDLNRQVLRLEFDQISLRVGEIKRGFGWARNVWAWGAPIAGFLLARKFKKTGNAFAKGSMMISVFKTGWRLWESWRGRRGDSGAEL